MTAAASATRRLRIITTPEGLPLSLQIAPIGSRIAAILLDLILMVTATLLAYFLLGLIAYALPGDVGNLVLIGVVLATFFIFNGYFLYFELRWRGATPGKRSVGLRVVSGDGGPLTTGAIFARNLMRDLELYLPLQVLFAPEAFYGPAPGWAVFLATLWIFLFLLLPLFNSDRARCGDLVAGTLVVERPEGRLLPDVAESLVEKIGEPLKKYHFSDRQLDMYGIKELQVLEEVLRIHSRKKVRTKVIHTVCTKIMEKIGWSSPVARKEEVEFLQAFYRAQRHRLEQGLLLGKRREKKRKGRLARD